MPDGIASAGLRHPASASCLGRHSRLAGRCPNNSSLFPPLAAVVVVAAEIVFLICCSETPAGVSEQFFHGKGAHAEAILIVFPAITTAGFAILRRAGSYIRQTGTRQQPGRNETKGANLPCFKALGRCSAFWVVAA